MDWLKKIAPTVLAALGSPIAAVVAEMIGSAIGAGDSSVDSIKDKLSSMSLTPDQVVAIKEIEARLKEQEKALGFKYAELELRREELYVGDTEAARRAHSQNEAVFKLGVATILAFAFTMALLLLGCYMVLTKGIEMKDPGTVAVVFSLIGTIVGYMASNAQQVYNYFFGSSRGSADKTNALSAAVTKLQSVVEKK